MLSYDHLPEPSLVPRSAETLKEAARTSGSMIRKQIRSQKPPTTPSVFSSGGEGAIGQAVGDAALAKKRMRTERVLNLPKMRQESEAAGARRRRAREGAKVRASESAQTKQRREARAGKVMEQRQTAAGALEKPTAPAAPDAPAAPAGKPTAPAAPDAPAAPAGKGRLRKGTEAVLGTGGRVLGTGGKILGYGLGIPAAMAGLGAMSLLSPKKKRRREEELFGMRDPYGAMAGRYYM